MSDVVSYPSPTELRFSRVVGASPTLVWRAHTEQGQLERWWGPQGFTLNTHVMDVRPGGCWKFVMRGPVMDAGAAFDRAPTGQPSVDYPNLIQYEEVVPRQRLAWAHGDFEQVMFHVTTTLAAEGEGTRLETTMRFPSQAHRDATASYGVPGHASAMRKLEAYLRQPHHELSFTRVLNAPVTDVWAAWTVPAQLMPWYCPAPWRVTACDIDLRPGGRFFTCMEGPDGERQDLSSCYLVVEPERRLIWTNALQPGYAPAAKPWCTCSVEMQPVDGGQTRLTARVMHADSLTCEEHAAMGFPQGWHVALDQMLALRRSA